MKRASYREAIAWIAENDSGGDEDALNPDTVSELVTSCLVADLFGVPCARVGEDIVKYRVLMVTVGSERMKDWTLGKTRKPKPVSLEEALALRAQRIHKAVFK
jgi:hypothetical protein